MRGFIQGEFVKSHMRDFVRDMSGWVADGSVRYREDVVEGLDAAPEAFRGCSPERTSASSWSGSRRTRRI